MYREESIVHELRTMYIYGYNPTCDRSVSTCSFEVKCKTGEKMDMTSSLRAKGKDPCQDYLDYEDRLAARARHNKNVAHYIARRYSKKSADITSCRSIIAKYSK